MSRITSDQVKAIIASYWRYLRQCPVIALEVNANLSPYMPKPSGEYLAAVKRAEETAKSPRWAGRQKGEQ